MLRRAWNTLLFGWGSFLSALVGLTACIAILLEENLKIRVRNGKQSGIFLADKRRAMFFYRFFSKVYDLLNPFFYDDYMRREVVRMADIHPGCRVLDVGCGTGYTTAGVLTRVKTGEVVGIDLTPQQLRKAARKLRPKNVIFHLSRGDAENLPFRDGTFDAIISVGAIEYFPNPLKAVQEMKRVAKSHGKVVVGGPELRWFKRLMLNKMLYTPTKEELQGFFDQAKLSNVRGALTGVNTFFNTGSYAVIVAGEK